VDQVVFIGGAIAPLLQTHPIAPRVRPTTDVDGVAITATYSAFDALVDQLRARGFRQLSPTADEPGHAHRWITPAGTAFDLMPTGRHFGGSGNPLDEEAVHSAIWMALDAPSSGPLAIRHAAAPAFLALKWAAFRDRGHGVLLVSHDVEDIFAVLAARPSLPAECEHASPAVRHTIRAMASSLRRDADLLGEAMHAHVVVEHRPDTSRVHQQVERALHRLAALS
jgi:hypothetical protein